MILTRGCKYHLLFEQNGKTVSKMFDSEEALDAFLKDNELGIKIDQINKTFSLDLKEASKTKLKEAYIKPLNRNNVQTTESPEDPDVEVSSSDYIGVTRFISTPGSKEEGKPLMTGYNKDQYRINQAKDWIEKGYTESEAYYLADLELAEHERFSLVGDETHKILEHVFNDTEITETFNQLTPDLVESIKTQATELKEKIKRDIGEDCEFFTEYSIKSKKVSELYKPLLEAQGKIGIMGIVDLLVIDKNGRVYLYDFKTSRKKLVDWNTHNDKENRDYYSTAKKGSIQYQLGFYTAILRQYGINVVSTQVVPIHTQYKYDPVEVHGKSHNIKIDHLAEVTFETPLEVPRAKSGTIYQNVISVIPSEGNVTNEEVVKISQKMDEQFKGLDVNVVVQKAESTVQYYKDHPESIHLSRVPEHYKRTDGAQWMFKPKGVSERWIFAKDETDLNDKLNDYVKDLNSKKASTMETLANNIERAVVAKNLRWDQIADDFGFENRSFITRQFKKYVENGWDFIKDEPLNNFGIFVFTKGDVSEIVVVTNKPLMTKFKMGIGSSILGRTLEDANVDSREIMEATHGNIELIKALFYIQQKSEFFKDYKVQNIRAINPWNSGYTRQVTALNSQLIYNFNMMAMRDANRMQQIDQSLFVDSTRALVNMAFDNQLLVEELGVDFTKLPNAEDMVANEEWLRNVLRLLKQAHPELYNPESMNLDSELWMTYSYLEQALLANQGIFITTETNPGNYTTAGSFFNITGLQLASAQFSPSANIRLFGQIHDQYVNEVREMTRQKGQDFMTKLTAFYNDETSKIMGVDSQIFEAWFEKDVEGNISDNFRLIDPNSKEFKGSAKARAVVESFLETMWSLRYPNATEKDKEDAKMSKIYYEVPLTEAVFSRQRKKLGFLTAAKNKLAEFKTLTEGVFAEDENPTKREKDSNISIKQTFEREHNTVYNKFALDPTARANKIQEHKVGFFETNLELVFNQALQAYSRQEVSKKYVPMFQAMRIALEHQRLNGQKNADIIETFDKMVKSKFYGEPIIKEDLRSLYSWLNVFRRVFTGMSLGLNFTSGFRELIYGTLMGYTRSAVGKTLGVSAKNYDKAMRFVLKESYKNWSSVSMLQQLNYIYGMANMSLSNVADQRRLNFLGIRNWSTDTLFLASSSPDFQHRVTVLVAKMLEDGVIDIQNGKITGAYSLDSNGVIQYDWRKDKRFSDYVNENIDSLDYLKQKSLYEAYIQEYNRTKIKKKDGTSFKLGDDLPQAYPFRESQSLKNHADLLYGHYDDNSRSLIFDTFLGSFFLQYRTYITARFEQYFMKAGTYNTEELKQQFDPETGEELYIKVEYPDGDETKIPYRKIVKKSEVTDEDVKENRAGLYYKWEGVPMEGIAKNMWAFTKAACTLDGKKLKELMNNPLKKNTFFLGLSDFVFWGLLAIIIRALFAELIGEDDWYSDKAVRAGLRDEGPLLNFLYKTTHDVAAEGPITKIVTDMFTSGVPLYNSANKLVTSTWSLMTGNSNLAYAITQNFGLARDFQGLAKQME